MLKCYLCKGSGVNHNDCNRGYMIKHFGLVVLIIIIILVHCLCCDSFLITGLCDCDDSRDKY